MLTDDIGNIIARLRAPVTPEEAAAGWTEKSKGGILPFFEGLLSDLKNSKQIPYIGIVRSLDAWGVDGGRLYDEIINVAAHLNSRADDRLESN